VIVRAQGAAGKIRVVATGEGLAPGELEITAEKPKGQK